MLIKLSRTITVYTSKLFAIKQSWFNSYFWRSASESAIKFFKYTRFDALTTKCYLYNPKTPIPLYMCASVWMHVYGVTYMLICCLHLQSLTRKITVRNEKSKYPGGMQVLEDKCLNPTFLLIVLTSWSIEKFSRLPCFPLLLSLCPPMDGAPGEKHLTEIRTYQQHSPVFTHLEPMKCGVVTNGEGYELKISVSGSHTLGNARFARAACRKRNSTKCKQMYKAPSMRRESGVLAPSISASGENANSEPILSAQ